MAGWLVEMACLLTSDPLHSGKAVLVVRLSTQRNTLVVASPHDLMPTQVRLASCWWSLPGDRAGCKKHEFERTVLASSINWRGLVGDAIETVEIVALGQRGKGRVRTVAVKRLSGGC